MLNIEYKVEAIAKFLFAWSQRLTLKYVVQIAAFATCSYHRIAHNLTRLDSRVP